MEDSPERGYSRAPELEDLMGLCKALGALDVCALATAPSSCSAMVGSRR